MTRTGCSRDHRQCSRVDGALDRRVACPSARGLAGDDEHQLPRFVPSRPVPGSVPRGHACVCSRHGRYRHVRDWLKVHLWLAGHGFCKLATPNSQTGVAAVLERAIVDLMVFSPRGWILRRGASLPRMPLLSGAARATPPPWERSRSTHAALRDACGTTGLCPASGDRTGAACASTPSDRPHRGSHARPTLPGPEVEQESRHVSPRRTWRTRPGAPPVF